MSHHGTPRPGVPDTRPPEQVVLVRHAETEWSVAGRHTGRTDLELTEAGRVKAGRVGDGLAGQAFGRVLTSPMTRAVQTCRLAGYAEVAESREDLREWDYGEYEGLTTATVHEQRPDWELFRHGAPGGESPDDVARRADRLVDELTVATTGDGPVLVVGHGHQLRTLAVRWAGLSVDSGRLLQLDAGAISRLGWKRRTRVLTTWNDTCHLTDPGR